MVSPDEVILELDHTLDRIWIVFLEQKEQLGFHSSLIVVLLLVLDHLDRHHFARFVVLAFEHLAKRTLSDEFNILKSVADLITRNDAIVAFVVVEAIVDESL